MSDNPSDPEIIVNPALEANEPAALALSEGLQQHYHSILALMDSVRTTFEEIRNAESKEKSELERLSLPGHPYPCQWA